MGRTFAPKIKGLVKWTTAMSAWRVLFIFQLGWRMKRERTRIWAFGSPWSKRNVEPALILYIDGGSLARMQWAAVRALVAVNIEHPQIWPLFRLNWHWYGYSSIVVIFPPMILSSSIRCGAARIRFKNIIQSKMYGSMELSNAYLWQRQIEPQNTEKSLSFRRFSARLWSQLPNKSLFYTTKKIGFVVVI